jgi:hypothetical protein
MNEDTISDVLSRALSFTNSKLVLPKSSAYSRSDSSIVALFSMVLILMASFRVFFFRLIPLGSSRVCALIMMGII